MTTRSFSQIVDAPRRNNRAPRGLQEVLNRLAKVALFNSPCCYFECFAETLEADLDRRTLSQLQLAYSIRKTTHTGHLQRGDSSVNEIKLRLCDVTTQTGFSTYDDCYTSELHLVTERLGKVVHDDELETRTITQHGKSLRDIIPVEGEKRYDWPPSLNSSFMDVISDNVNHDPSGMKLDESTPDCPYDSSDLPATSIRDFCSVLEDSDVSACDSNAAEAGLSVNSDMAHHPAFDTRLHQWKVLDNDVAAGDAEVLDDLMHLEAEMRMLTQMVSSSRTADEEYDPLLSNDDTETISEHIDRMERSQIDTHSQSSFNQSYVEYPEEFDDSLASSLSTVSSKDRTRYDSGLHILEVPSVALGYGGVLASNCYYTSNDCMAACVNNPSALGIAAQYVPSFESTGQSLVMSDHSDISEDHPSRRRIGIDIERMMNSQETGDGSACFFSRPFDNVRVDSDQGRFAEREARRTNSDHISFLADEDAFIAEATSSAAVSNSQMSELNEVLAKTLGHENLDFLHEDQNSAWANFDSMRELVDEQSVRVFVDDGVSPRSLPSIPLHRTESLEDLLVLDEAYGGSCDGRSLSDLMAVHIDASVPTSVLMHGNAKRITTDCKATEAESNPVMPNAETTAYSSEQPFDRTISCPVFLRDGSYKCQPSSDNTQLPGSSLMQTSELNQNWTSRGRSESETSASSVVTSGSSENVQQALLQTGFSNVARDHSSGSSDTEVSLVSDFSTLHSAGGGGRWATQQEVTSEFIKKVVPNQLAWMEYIGSIGKLVPIDESIEWLADHDADNVDNDQLDRPSIWEPSDYDVLPVDTRLHATKQPAFDINVLASKITEPGMLTAASCQSVTTQLEDVIQKMQRIRLTVSNDSTELSDNGANPVMTEPMDYLEAVDEPNYYAKHAEWNVSMEESDELAWSCLPTVNDEVMLPPTDMDIASPVNPICELLGEQSVQIVSDVTYLKESRDSVSSCVSRYPCVNPKVMSPVTQASAELSSEDPGEFAVASRESVDDEPHPLIKAIFGSQFLAKQGLPREKTWSEATELSDSYWQSDRDCEIGASVEFSEDTENTFIIDAEDTAVDDFHSVECDRERAPNLESGTAPADSAVEVSTSVSSSRACYLISEPEPTVMSEGVILPVKHVDQTDSSGVVDATEFRAKFKCVAASLSDEKHILPVVSTTCARGDILISKTSQSRWEEMPIMGEVGIETVETFLEKFESTEEMSESHKMSKELREYDRSSAHDQALSETLAVFQSTCISELVIAPGIFESADLAVLPAAENEEFVIELTGSSRLAEINMVHVPKNVGDELSEYFESDSAPTNMLVKVVKPEQLDITTMDSFSAYFPDMSYPVLHPSVALESEKECPIDVLSTASSDVNSSLVSYDQADQKHYYTNGADCINEIAEQPQAEQWQAKLPPTGDSEYQYSTENCSVLLGVENDTSDIPVKINSSPSYGLVCKLGDSRQATLAEEMQVFEDSEAVDETGFLLKSETHYEEICSQLQVSNSRRLFTIHELETEVADDSDGKIEMLSQGDSPDVDWYPETSLHCSMQADFDGPSDANVDDKLAIVEVNAKQLMDTERVVSTSGIEDTPERCAFLSGSANVAANNQIFSSNLGYPQNLKLGHSRSVFLHSDLAICSSSEGFTGIVEKLSVPSVQQADELIEQAEVIEFFDAVEFDEIDTTSGTQQAHPAVSLSRQMGISNDEDANVRCPEMTSSTEVSVTCAEAEAQSDVSNTSLPVSNERGQNFTDCGVLMSPSDAIEAVLGVDSVLPCMHSVEECAEVGSCGKYGAESGRNETDEYERLDSVLTGHNGSYNMPIHVDLIAYAAASVAQDVPAVSTPTDLLCNLEKIHTPSEYDENESDDSDELSTDVEESVMNTGNRKTKKQHQDEVQADEIRVPSEIGLGVPSRLNKKTLISSETSRSKSDELEYQGVITPFLDDADDKDVTIHDINKLDVLASQSFERSSSSHQIDLDRKTYSDIQLDQEARGTMEERVYYGSCDTICSADTLYSDATSEKAAKADSMSVSSRDLKVTDDGGVTTDDEFY